MDCLTVEAEVAGIESDGHLQLQVSPGSMCAGCSGSCIWKRAERLRFYPTDGPSPIRKGSRVVVTLPARVILRGSLMLHGLPLGLILLGALAGTAVSATDMGAVIGTVLGLATSLSIVSNRRTVLERKTLSELSIRVVS